VFDLFIAPENIPFVLALVLMVMIGIVEALGLGASGVDLDSGLDGDLDSGSLHPLAWLGIGRVPLLMLMVLLLAVFGLVGLLLQQVAAMLTGSPLSLWIAVPAAFVLSLPLTGLSARAVERIMPHDETTAVALDSLVGRRATVTTGVARAGSPARARVRDIHGQAHHVMMEPSGELPVGEGETVLLVRREGEIFIGLAEGETLTALADSRFGANRF
jgi:membrane protein implicated in regulation of membrane protease activity